MGYLSEKASYLRGLADGMKLDEKTNEGKMIWKMLELLEELSSNFEDLSSEVLEGESRVDEIEDCLDELCEELDGCTCGCEDDEEDNDELLDEELDDLDLYEITCPHCKNKVFFDEDMIENDNLICPNCKEEIEIEICGDDCDDCDCEDCDDK